MTEPAVTELPTIPLIESEVDEQTTPFQVAYTGADGQRVVETFAARLNPPFAVYQRIRDVERVAPKGIPEEIAPALERLFRTALPAGDATRLIDLIEGDEETVGTISPKAIGGIVDFIKTIHYTDTKVPTPPNSRSGPKKRAGRTSQAGPSARKSTSTRSAPAKA